MCALFVSPVAVTIQSADSARSLAFYRGVLGFEGNAAGEAVRGPVRIEMGSECAASIAFFEVDDVAGMRAEILARGGTPGEIQRVNWIKTAMFEVRDPDGNALWFGKSFAEPDCAPHTGQFLKGMPGLPLTDVRAGIAYYRDVLGFKINYAQDDLGVMDRDAVTVLLIARTPEHQGVGSAFFYVERVDDLCAELRAKGANVQGDPISYPWGLRHFDVLDLEGNTMRFAQTFE